MCLSLLILVVISNKESEKFVEELEKKEVCVAPNLLCFLFELLGKLEEVKCTLPSKKLLILIWKMMQAFFGDSKNVSQTWSGLSQEEKKKKEEIEEKIRKMQARGKVPVALTEALEIFNRRELQQEQGNLTPVSIHRFLRFYVKIVPKNFHFSLLIL